MKLSQAEFGHNSTINRNTGFAPFHVVYGVMAHETIDLLAILSRQQLNYLAHDLISELHQLHEDTQSRLRASTTMY